MSEFDKQIEDIECLEIVMKTDFYEFSKNTHYLTGASSVTDAPLSYLHDRYNDALNRLQNIERAIKAFRDGNIQDFER